MGGNYEKNLYNQLMEVMTRLDTVERESRHEIRGVGDPSSRKYASMQIRMGNSTFRMNTGVMWFTEQM